MQGMRSAAPRVAHYLDTYLFRTGTWIYSQIAHLKKWQPVIVCLRTENLDSYPAAALYALNNLCRPNQRYNRAFRRLFGYFPLFCKAIRQERAQLIHAHFGPMGFEALPLGKACRVPVVTTFYGYDLSRLPQREPRWRERYHRLFAEGALFLVEGSHMRRQLVDLGCPEDKIIVQHLGVDVEKLRFVSRKPEPDGTVCVLVAATFTEKKGVPYAVEAFARVRQAHDNVRLTVIGDARNRPDEQAIKREVHEIVGRYNVGNSVRFMGYQPYQVLIEQFYRHHILISPSVQARDGNNEGGAPVTIIEASATGMPVLSTLHCDIPEVVMNGQGGFLVPERDLGALTERLENLVLHPEVLPIMGKAGRRHIETEFSLSVQVERLERLYDVVDP